MNTTRPLFSITICEKFGDQVLMIKMNRKNSNHIRVMVNKICEELHITKQNMVDYIYNLPERYIKVKQKSFTGSSAFVEVESFASFMGNL